VDAPGEQALDDVVAGAEGVRLEVAADADDQAAEGGWC
jgi:hypothetical protein